MALQSLPGIWVPRPQPELKGNLSTLGIDASGEKIAFVLHAPKTGSIDRVGILVGFVTSSQTLKVSLQDVSNVDGNPDGTIDQSATIASPATDTFYEVTLGSTRSVTKGDRLAIVVEFDTTVGNLYIQSVDSTAYYMMTGVTYCLQFTGAWAKFGMFPICSLRYTDTTYPYYPGIMPIVGTSTESYNLNSSPDEYALRGSFPFTCRAVGAYAMVDGDGDYDVVLYADTTTSISNDKDVRLADTNIVGLYWFPSPAIITAGSVWRLAVKPTTSTGISTYTWQSGPAIMEHMDGGLALYRSSRTDGGAWTNDTDRRPHNFGLVLDAIDVSAGGGSTLIGMA